MTASEQADAWNGDEGRHWVEHRERYDQIMHRLTPHLLQAADVATEQRVIDVGCGSGQTTCLAARAARHGLAVGVDLSAPLLDEARRRAAHEGLTNAHFEQGDAQVHPFASAGYDVAISRFGERHVVWTLPDPRATLARWREAAPTGRLVLFESAWGSAADPGEALKARARKYLRRLHGVPAAHHGDYPSAVLAALPYGSGIAPGVLVELAESSGWLSTRIERLRDVEWAMTTTLPHPDRLLGATAPYYAVVAG